MSAVKTGMPAWLAAAIEVPIARESQGHSTMASTCLVMKSLTWFFWFATLCSPAVTITL